MEEEERKKKEEKKAGGERKGGFGHWTDTGERHWGERDVLIQ